MPRPTEGLRVAGVVLAAGASRRMGRNKMLLELEGEPLVRRAARRALEAGLSPVVVVLGHEAEQARAALAGLSVEIATNPDFRGPTSGSLHAGLARLAPDRDAVVVLLGDMVLVTAPMLADLARLPAGDAPPLVLPPYPPLTPPPPLFPPPPLPYPLARTGA